MGIMNLRAMKKKTRVSVLGETPCVHKSKNSFSRQNRDNEIENRNCHDFGFISESVIICD